MNKKNNKLTIMGRSIEPCANCKCENLTDCPSFKEIDKLFKEIFGKVKAMEELLKSDRVRQVKVCSPGGRKLRLDGDAIVKIRQKYKLTQTELGLILDANLTSVNRWERGKTVPCRGMVEKLFAVRDMGCRKVRRLLREKVALSH